MEKLKVDLSEYKNEFSFRNKAGRVIWNISYIFLFRPFALPFFRKWRIFILRLFGGKINYSSVIYASARVWAPWNLEMHAHACIGRNVDCYNQGKITIKESAVVSQKTYLCASSHDITDRKHPLITKPIVIESQAWVAADAFIGPGVTIGEGAVVAARSAVFKDVDPWTIVRGNPAEFVKLRVIKDN